MEFIQDVLTYAIEAIALSTLLLPIHYAGKQVKTEVDSWGVPHVSATSEAPAANTPESRVEVEQSSRQTPTVSDPWESEVEQNNIVSLKLEVRHFSPVLALPPAPEVANKVRSAKARSAGAAAVDYRGIKAEQLRKECTKRGIEWRGVKGGKHLSKSEMIARLTE